ncbi:hypothetical protein PT974_12089 [Cladobotryum mycophilum]|uniref:F-box domain-containing protein n=1 Tax=Cladobotryum mycophilum TaxID=491253 RepID=A0ABR0S712_9HYPO
MSETHCPVKSLPNELLSTILSELSSNDLLPAVAVDRLWHSLAVRILHRRLLSAASLPDNELILECYHPSAKISTPYLSCRYLGMSVRDGPAGVSAAAMDGECPSFADLRRLYSSFRPVKTEDNRQRRPRFGWIMPSVGSSAQAAAAAARERDEDETATEDVHLDDGERFSQLCTVTNVVKPGIRPGLFSHHINISDGVIRVFRHWLASMASDNSAAAAVSNSSSSSSSEATTSMFSSDDPRVLWVDDDAKSVGLRFRVMPGPSERMPLISDPDEDDPPVTYKLVYEEILVRTSKLLLAAEQTTIPHAGLSGKDIIIAPM